MALNINSSGHFRPSSAYYRVLEPAHVTPAVDKVMKDFVRNLKEDESKAAAIDNMQSTVRVGRTIDVFA